MVRCEWCDSPRALESQNTVYWELPDGSKAIQITNTPAISCPDCSMTFQTEETTKKIEDQLLLVDTKKIGKTIDYHALMAMPRLLKRNYFDFF
jgi:uncharacterized YokU family protein